MTATLSTRTQVIAYLTSCKLCARSSRLSPTLPARSSQLAQQAEPIEKSGLQEPCLSRRGNARLWHTVAGLRWAAQPGARVLAVFEAVGSAEFSM